MTIETASVSGPLLVEYARIPIAFEVRSVLSATGDSGGSLLQTERAVEHPYVKDYDAISVRPPEWPIRFDTAQWVLFLARVNDQRVGGATVAYRTADLDMLEGRDDLAVLWDIRVLPSFRRQGVGRRLFDVAERWALAQGCRELKIETQNVNVAACRFYAALGCELRVVRHDAYPDCPGEAQLLWYKPLKGSRQADDPALPRLRQ